MPSIIPTLIAALGRGRAQSDGDCLVCHDAVRSGQAKMRLPGGGYVHSSCSTYRMRQRERIRRTLAT